MFNAETHAILDAVIATSPLHVVVYDRDGSIVYASSAALDALAHALGDSRDEIVHSPGAMNPVDIQASLRRVMESGHLESIQTASGSEIVLTPILDEQGKVALIACTIPLDPSKPHAENAPDESDLPWRFVPTGSAVWDWNVQANRMTYSDALWKLLGREMWNGRASVEDFDARVHPEDKPRVLEHTVRLLRGDIPALSQEYRLRCEDGRYKWILSRGRVVRRSPDGSPVRVIGTVLDITSFKNAQNDMQLASQVFTNVHEGILVTDRENRITSVNPAFCRLSGYTRAEILGQDPRIFSSGRHDAAFFRELWNSLHANGEWRGEIWNRRKNGEIHPDWLSITVVRDHAGAIERHIALYSDIKECREAAERIHYLANYDTLTGLANGNLLRNRLNEAIAQAQRAHGQLALLTIDLDRFKQINDSLGHASGDEMLKLVARRLQEIVPAQGLVARHAGDEFHVLLPNVDMGAAASMADAIIEGLSRPYVLEGHEVTVPPSIGISLFPDDGNDTTTLIENAEAAMFHAKELGRSRYQFFSPEMNASALQKMTLENSLRRALEQEEFLIHFQPQIDPRHHRIVGAEALLRWKHPEMDMVSPHVFIALAEESGVIIPLGEWMIRKVCQQIRAWQQSGAHLVPISVNLSSRQFSQPELPQRIADILQESGVDPFFLEIELTESTVMHDIEEAASMLRRIKELGIRIAVDDFGTGYSSLAYLKRFHIDKLKIDQSFIRELVDNPDDSAIVRAIISMAHSLRLEVVAEGVETQKQLDYLKAIHCDYIQGYFYSEALSAEAFADLLRENKTKP